MTDSRHGPGQCLDLEDVAAFIDGHVSARARTDVESHLNDCERCYELLVEVTATMAESRSGESPAVTHRPGWRRRGLYAAAGIAAALAITVLLRPYLDPNYRLQRDVRLVLTSAEHRPLEGRLTGEDRWRPAAAPTRGERPEEQLPAEARIALIRVQESLTAGRTLRRLAAHGRAQLAAGRIDAGVAALEEAVALQPEASDLWADLAAGYIARASTPERASDLPRALEAVNRAVALDGARADYQFNRAIVLEKLNLRPLATEAWQAYLAVDPDSSWAAEARERLARLERPSPVSDAAPLREVLLLCVVPTWAAAALRGQRSEGWIDDARAIVGALSQQGRDDYATDVVEAMVSSVVSPLRSERTLRAVLAYADGRAAYAAHRFESAGVRLAVAKQELERAGHPLALSAAVYLGIVAFRQKQFVDAHGLLEAVIASAGREYGSVSGRAHWTRGLMWLLEGRRRDAAVAYRTAIDELSRAGEVANAAFVTGLLATGYERMGDRARMWDARVRALQGSSRDGTLLRAASEARVEGWYRAAREFTATALANAREAGSAAPLIDALRWAAIGEAELGHLDRAASLVAEARGALVNQPQAASDRLAAELDETEALIALRGGNTEAGLAKASRALAYFNSTSPPSDDRIVEGLLLRARLARRLGRTHGARADLAEGVAIFRRMRHFADPGVDQAMLADVARQLTDELVSLVASDDEGLAFDEAERVRAWDLGRLTMADPVTLPEARARIPAATVIATYVVGNDMTYLWSIRRGASAMARLDIGRERLASLVGAFRVSASEGIAEELSRLLIDSVVGLRDGDVLAIVPDGPLHTLSFAALKTARGEYLAEAHPLIMGPSVSYLLRSNPQARRAQALLVVGNPAFTASAWPGLADLPGAAAEAETVAGSGPGAVHLHGRAATRQAVVEHLQNAGVLHFAGHAVVNEFTADDSALVLAGTDALSAGEIRRLNLDHMALAVLASCEGAGGFMPRSDGPLGLARALLSAGVGAVVASLRPVDDRRAQRFFVAFHEGIRRGTDPARALQQAQRDAIAADGSRDAARHWSSYVLAGSLVSAGFGIQ